MLTSVGVGLIQQNMTDTKKIFTDRYNEVKKAFKQAVTKGKYVFGRDFPDAYAYYMLELKDGYEFLVDDSSVNGYYELADFPKMKDVIAIDFWDGAMYETRWTREKITETDKNGNSTVLGGLFTFKKKPKPHFAKSVNGFSHAPRKTKRERRFAMIISHTTLSIYTTRSMAKNHHTSK